MGDRWELEVYDSATETWVLVWRGANLDLVTIGEAMNTYGAVRLTWRDV